MVLRIHFTAEDLLGTRFADGPAPLLELELTVAMLQRPGVDPAFARRNRLLGAAASRSVVPLTELVPATGAGPFFLDPLSVDLEHGLELVRSSTNEVVRSELDRICRNGLPVTPLMRGLANADRQAWRYLEDSLRTSHSALIDAVWPRLRTGFDIDLAWRGQVQREQGLRGMLAGLYPGSRWRGSTLEIAVARQLDFRLEGGGVLLLPSAQWTGEPLCGPLPDGPLLLVYPALTPLPHLPEEAPAPGAAPEEPVAALLGRTRSAVLRLTLREPTTSQLARELGISVASASEHTRTLRRAGLVSTVRAGRAVRHSCTPLGHRLLAAAQFPAPPPLPDRAGAAVTASRAVAGP
ncbi:helix-turn-helix protein [Streptomyces sp. 1114.5]|uniref:ArsR/SmtB family transcription factor n=1 Tax=Streptomyces sp. 1114.5 TaxID=1938830 RepID=UPI000EB55FDF|nr:winged helix-turn-helix domain-containing protein [Streptomyces sp. 1114.5]RKT19489.1 helix-turn-helix protein [Streptomyces sp. 1114.5]